MVNSSLLLLIIPEAGDNRLIITGKIYEYIAARKPVLCLGPENGEAAIIISKLKNGICLDYSDSEKIKSYILGVMKNPFIMNNDHSEYSRRNLTQKLASLL
jgi:hypothetical protein